MSIFRLCDLYLSNLPPGRVWHKIIFMWWGVGHKWIETHARPSQKCLIPSAFHCDASDAKQWTRQCKAGIAWRVWPFGTKRSFSHSPAITSHKMPLNPAISLSLVCVCDVEFSAFAHKYDSVKVFGIRLLRGLRGLSRNLMYGTRPWCLVQAMTRHTCPDPHLGSWNCLPYQAHIAPSETMSSIDQQGSSLGSFPTFPSPLSPL